MLPNLTIEVENIFTKYCIYKRVKRKQKFNTRVIISCNLNIKIYNVINRYNYVIKI